MRAPACPICGADYAQTDGSIVERRPDGDATCGACGSTTPWRDWSPATASAIDAELAKARAARGRQIEILHACQCMYPLITNRNGSGHAATCPGHLLWQSHLASPRH